jgi:hypothetical protein
MGVEDLQDLVGRYQIWFLRCPLCGQSAKLTRSRLSTA